jgi:hypothetical protein
MLAARPVFNNSCQWVGRWLLVLVSQAATVVVLISSTISTGADIPAVLRQGLLMRCDVCAVLCCVVLSCVVLTHRWPCSWSAWSLFCCLCSQSGRLGSWLKHVALLRARHPDSLALQVSAHILLQVTADILQQQPLAPGPVRACQYLTPH